MICLQLGTMKSITVHRSTPSIIKMVFSTPSRSAQLRQTLAALSVVWLLTIVDATCSVQAIFNFGDSNSDTGGFWAAFPSQSGPFGMTYFHRPAGRASDGRLAIDFLAQGLGLPFLSPYLQSIGTNFRHGANFATLGSTVLLPNTSVFATGISPFSLAIQLNQMKEFKVRVLGLEPEDHLPPHDIFSNSLYTIDIGQNDFTSNLAAIGTEEITQFLRQVVAQIDGTIKELHKLGGRMFLVFNLAPVGCYPASLSQHSGDSSDIDSYGCIISYNNGVSLYNSMLNETIHRTQEQLRDASVIYVDTSSLKLELFQNPKGHGLLYGTRACCGQGGGAYNFNPRVYCGNSKMINGSLVNATACVNPESYASWDGIHATEVANKLVALAVLNGSLSDPPFSFSTFCMIHPVD